MCMEQLNSNPIQGGMSSDICWNARTGKKEVCRPPTCSCASFQLYYVWNSSMQFQSRPECSVTFAGMPCGKDLAVVGLRRRVSLLELRRCAFPHPLAYARNGSSLPPPIVALQTPFSPWLHKRIILFVFFSFLAVFLTFCFPPKYLSSSSSSSSWLEHWLPGLYQAQQWEVRFFRHRFHVISPMASQSTSQNMVLVFWVQNCCCKCKGRRE